ncbi:MAG: methyltransferase domain-containing protein [Ardenticatenaceae bacterium]|nr:methyltransferase domain-containing protein [Ardenticatenaceae bacterium]
MSKSLIKEQFGANAAAYVTSQPHAKGASLARLVELVKPQPAWKMLDIATAAGHTAFIFAPHVAHVWATDITPEMLVLAQQQAQERGFANVTVETADAEVLPYDDASFDLVTCRIAPHHFGDVALFVREAARVLRPGGILAVVDNVVPAGPAGDYVNAFEKLRDPSHGRCLTTDEWLTLYQASGLAILQHETITKQMEFDKWAARHTPTMQQNLRAMLSEVEGEAKAFLQPTVAATGTTFMLQEGIIIGQKST